MTLSRRRFVTSSAAALGAAPLAAIPPRPKLYVLLVVEQFRADYLERYGALLGTGGFRRLMDEGSYFPDCDLAASSFSSTAIATIASGAYPEAHGIVADSWFEASSGKVVRAAAGDMLATTLADEVQGADGNSLVIGSAMTMSGAAMLAGGARQKIFSLEPSDGGFAWLDAFQKGHAPQRHKGARWNALQAEAGAPALRVLVDDPSRPDEFLALYRASPFATEDHFELLRTAMQEERAGMGETVDLVMGVVGSTALLGHEVGADSPLMREMVLHLDRQIEITLDRLDKMPGQGKYALIFTAGHGTPPASDAAKMTVAGDEVARAIDKALSNRYDVSSVKNRYVERYVYPFLHLRHEQLRRYGIEERDARRAAGEAALRVPGVAAYYTADGDCSRSGKWLNRFRNSFHAVRSGDVMLSYLPLHVEQFAAGRGVSYGSLYNYDTRVPLIFFGPQFRAQVVERVVETVDIAPTLARAMRVAAPSSATGRVLSEVFAADPVRKK